MKTIYFSLVLFLFASAQELKANCPPNNPPSNLSATSICEKGISTFTGTLNDLSNTLVWLDTANRIIGSGNNHQHYISTLGLNFKAAEMGYDSLSTSFAPLPSAFNSTYPAQNFTNGQYFTCAGPLRIDSILLKVNNPLSGYIQIWSNAPENNGYILQKFPFNITSTGPKEVRVALAAMLSAGNYFINVEITSGTGVLYRALTGATYPYQVSNLISITGNNFSASNSRYYYFFDWDVSKMCMSPISTAFSPIYTQTHAETLPYFEVFNGGIPCDWTNTAANTNALWLSGASSSFTIPNFTIPADPGILISSDVNCNCDKSSSKIASPWFDLRTYSKESSIKLNINYAYKAANNSKVYIHVRNASNSIQLIDSFSQQLNAYGQKSIEIRNFILNDSVQFIIEHKDNAGDSSIFVIQDISILENCSTQFFVNLKLKLDSYASEISWEIKDINSNEIVAMNLPYEDNVPYQPLLANDNRSICLVEGNTYSFKIKDNFGDGLNDGTNIGNYLLSTVCGDTLLMGANTFPYGGQVLPELAWDSVVFVAQKYKPNLGRDLSITLDDTLTLDAGPIGPYLWSTGDTTRAISLIGKNLGPNTFSYSVIINSNSFCQSADTISVNVIDTYSPKIKINLITDTKGSEIKWELRDVNTDTVVMSKGPFNDVIPYNANAATHADSVIVEFNQELVFKIIDLAGDGLFDGLNQGSVVISNNCIPVLFINNSKSFPNVEDSLASDSVIFNASEKPTFYIGDDFEICDGENITLGAGASAYQYHWTVGNTSFTGETINFSSDLLSIGENAITVSNNPSANCYSIDTIVITKKAKPMSTFQTIQLGGQLNAVANQVGASIYQWNFGDGNTGLGKSITHNYLSNGTYNVKLKVVGSNACEDSSSTSITINGVGLNTEIVNDIKIYPNPSNGIIFIETNKIENIKIQVMDLQGRIVKSYDKFSIDKRMQLNLDTLEKGTYLIRIQNEEGVVFNKITLE